jgi:hypothetical protein
MSVIRRMAIILYMKKIMAMKFSASGKVPDPVKRRI